MQYHLVHDPKDNEYPVLLKSGNTYYYHYSLPWFDSAEEALAKFNAFDLAPEQDVNNKYLIARIRTLTIFTLDSHPEYFL